MKTFKRLQCVLCVAVAAIVTLPIAAQRRSLDKAYGIAAAKLSVSAGSLHAPLTPYARSKGYMSGTAAAADQPYYILQASQGKGFVIVSGDERMAPVLAYSSDGTFPADSLPDNLQAWLQFYEQEYAELDAFPEASAPVGNSAIFPATIDSTNMVEPFLRSEWGQYDPYNRLCPEYKTDERSATGCGATVMAQCMYYYRYPDSGHGSYSYTTRSHGFPLSWDFDAHPIQWDVMKDSYPTSGTSETEGQAIAELMYGCGVSVNMDYDKESGSQHNTLMTSLNKYYGYDSDMALLKRNRMNDADWHSVLQDELKCHRPLITAAWTKGGAGHFFVIHGYHVDDGIPAYYINWGWRGRYDGYFVMPNLCYDGIEANTLSQDISVITGMQPENGIRDNSGVLLIEDVTVSGNHYNIDLKEINQITVNVNRIYGASLQTFKGDIRVYLVDADNNKTLLADLKDKTVRQNMELNAGERVTVPDTLESGTYTFQCYAYSYATGEEMPVMTQETTTLTVRNSAADYRAALAVADIQFTLSDDRDFTLETANVLNAASMPFSGRIQMLVTDYVTDRAVTTFGNTKTLTNLEQYNYISRTDTYSGTLPSTLTDGAYRIHLGALQDGYTNWGKVKKYIVEGGVITNLTAEASTPFWIIDGKATLTPPYFTLTYKIDGEVVNEESMIVGTPISEYAVTEREGYSFSGWGIVPEVMPARNLTIEGSYHINKYRVRFVADGTMVRETIQNYGTPIVVPDAPPKEGCTFQSWGMVPATVPAQDTEIFAIYTPNSYSVTYMVDDTVYIEMEEEYNSEITLPGTPVKEGHTFAKWEGLPAVMPASDIIVSAIFKKNKYFVQYLLPEGTQYSRQQYAYGSTIVFEGRPGRTGHTFLGWMDEDGQFLSAITTVPGHDVVYTAQFAVNSYAVNYIVDDAPYYTDSVAYKTPLTVIPALEKEGYIFSGWSWAPDTMPARDVSIKGTFKINKYYVQYLLPEGIQFSKQQYAYGSTIVFDRVPTKTGYTFTSWLDEDGQPLTEISTMPAHDVVYTAQFTVNQYKLTYIIDGQPYRTFIVDYGTDLTEFFAEDEDYYYTWKSLPATMPARDLEVNGTITAVGGIRNAESSVDDEQWYTLSGAKLSGRPAVRGTYIHRGKKVVVK